MKSERIVFPYKICLSDTPPPPNTLGIKNQNKRIVDIFDIDSHFPYLLSGETSHPHHLWDQKSEQRMEDILDRFPMSISTIWGNHLPFNFMLKFPIYYFDKPFNQ